LPTNVHALVSGVMLNVPVFLMIRFFLEFLTPIPWGWGLVVLLLGGITAVVSVRYAILSHDLKRALAYHSVENMGIILAGLGLALLFAADYDIRDPNIRNALKSISALSLIACLLHVIN